MSTVQLSQGRASKICRAGPWARHSLTLLLVMAIANVWSYDRNFAAPRNPAAIPCVSGMVNVNGVPPSVADVAMLASVLHQDSVPPGCYWYDRLSGAWGLVGGPIKGQIVAGLKLGGPLPVGASAGNTSVYVNGRELPSAELRAFWTQGVRLSPGSYWLDARGGVGRVGEPASWRLAGSPDGSHSNPPQDSIYESPGGGVGMVQGDCVIVSGAGYSAMSSGCED